MGNNEMIGHDPLAWIKEESVSEPEQSVAGEVNTVVEAAPQAEEPTTTPESQITTQLAAEAVQQSVAEPERESEPAAEPEPVAAAPVEPATENVVESQADPHVFDLGEQLVISNVGKIRAEWMERIVAGVESPITLEGGAVQSIDTAGLQLVIALSRQFGEDGISWQWGERSELLKSSASQLGLSQIMSL